MSGFVLVSGRDVVGSTDSMSSTLVHRGSEAEETRTTRTSIVGLNRPRGGYFSARTACIDGLALLVEGRVDNSDAILAGHPGKALAHALAIEYQRHGASALGRVRGAFVIAVVDEPADRLLLFRDLQGQRPAYYWSDGSIFIAASEVKALVRHPAYQARFDPSVLAHLLVTGVEPFDRSLAAGVCKVPPGDVVEWIGRGAPATRRLVEVETPVEPITVAEGADRLSSLLSGGLASRLSGQRDVGVFLSGGIDSYLLAAHLAGCTDFEVHAGTGGLVGDPRDETAAAVERARQLGIFHTAVPWPERREGETLLDLLQWTVTATEQPGRYENALLVRHLLNHWQDMPPVLISGDMADVLFGDAYYRALDRAELLQKLLPARALRAGLAVALHRVPLRRARSLAELARMLPHDFRLYFGGIFRHEGADRLLGFDPLEVIQADYNRLAQEARRLTRSQRYCLVHLRSSGQGSIDKLERLVSAAGADLVHPFLMDEVFQLGFSLPPASKYRQGRTKLVPRTLAARTLSRDAAWGRRMGFSAPRSEWILGDASLREGVDLLREPGARVRDFASGSELDRLVAASEQPGGDAHADLLWVLLSVELWARGLES